MIHPSPESQVVEAGPESDPTPFPGITGRALHTDHEQGLRAGILAFKAGAVFPEHLHPGGEYLLMLDGRLRLGDRSIGPGDFVYSPPGARHQAVALTDCRCFLLVPKPVTFPQAAE